MRSRLRALLRWANRNRTASVYVLTVVVAAAAIGVLSWAVMARQDDLEQVQRNQAALQGKTNKLVKQVQSIAVGNCTTINDNTRATYQVALAFKALADILNGVPGALPPGGKLHATVEEPDYLPCAAKAAKPKKAAKP